MDAIVPLPISNSLAGDLYELPIPVDSIQHHYVQHPATSTNFFVVEGSHQSLQHNVPETTSTPHHIIPFNNPHMYNGVHDTHSVITSDMFETDRMQQPQGSQQAQQGYFVARITGYVMTVNKKNNLKDPNVFTIRLPSSGKILQATYDGFLPVRSGDVIHCIGMVNQASQVIITQPPMVKLPIDRDSIIKCFHEAFYKDKRMHPSMFHKLFEKLDNLVFEKIYVRSSPVTSPFEATPETVHDVSDLLTLLSSRWIKSRNEDILAPLNDILDVNIQPHNVGARASILLEWWNNQRSLRQLYLLGINKGEIKRICMESSMSEMQLYERLLYNPYTIPQITLDVCKDIDTRTGRKAIQLDHYCGVIVRDIWSNYKNRGWMCTTYSWLKRKYPDIDHAKDTLISEYGVVLDIVEKSATGSDRVSDTSVQHKDEEKKFFRAFYLRKAYMAEITNTHLISMRMKKRDEVDLSDTNPNVSMTIHPGPRTNIGPPTVALDGLDEGQVRAVKMALEGGISVIRGHAGVGKTTVLKSVVANLEVYKTPYMLCSFTGNAVSRMKKVIPGSKPATIHRMIASPSRVPPFKYLIVDEASMVTTELFYDLLCTFGSDFDILMVGDSGQLPPIGAGSMFNEMLLSRCVRETVLEVCHRTHLDDGSMDTILLNCNRIAAWPDNEPYTPREGPNFIVDNSDETRVVNYIQSFHKMNVPHTEFVIISPYNKLLDQFNRMAQLIYNGSKMSVTDPNGKIWHMNDRVKMKVNNYTIDVMNGEEGIVTMLSPTSVTVDFGESGEPSLDGASVPPRRVVEIPFVPKSSPNNPQPYKSKNNENTDEDNEDEEEDKEGLCTKHISLSYAVTVHSTQGSEYLFVIFLMPTQSNIDGGFLNRNLVYTALSRARKMCIVMGNILNTFMAVGKPLPYRCEHLCERIKNTLPIINDESRRTVLDVFECDMDGYPDDALEAWDYD